MPVPCPGPADLVAYAAGGAAQGARAQLEAHAAECPRCREDLAVLALLAAPESPQEVAAIEGLTLDPGGAGALLDAAAGRARAPVLRSRGRFRWSVRGGMAVAAAVAAGVAVVLLRPTPPGEILSKAQGPERQIEAALSDVRWAPYRPHRGARDESAFDPALRALLEAREKGRNGADRALAILYLQRGSPGDAARTDQLLARAGDGADAENDRGAVLFTRGDVPAALDSFARALERDGAHRAARFNHGLALERLGLRDRAARAYDAAADDVASPWTGEARDRAARLRTAQSPGPTVSAGRLSATAAVFSASTPAEAAAAEREVAQLPPALSRDLAQLARWVSERGPAALAAHAALWKRYRELRGAALAGSLPVAEALAFARSKEVASDRLLWAPALQLAGYVLRSKGEWHSAQRIDLEVLRGCARIRCVVETEAIALDELAEAAGRDGDFAQAHRQQDRAEELLTSVAAEKQIAELHGKRSELLRQEGRLEEAARAAALAVRELADDAVAGAGPQRARSLAILRLADLAGAREQPRASLELYEVAVEQARAAGLGDLGADAAGGRAEALLALGRLETARRSLVEEIARQDAAGRGATTAELRLRLSQVADREGDAAAALGAADAGLAQARAGAWTSTVAGLRLARARALRALGRDAAAREELQRSVDEVARAARAEDDAAAAAGLARSGEEAAAELSLSAARAGRPAEELVLPLDALRAAALRVRAVEKGWSTGLDAETCVLALLPGPTWTLAVEVSRGGGSWTLLDRGRAALQKLSDPTELAPVLAPAIGKSCARGGEMWLLAGAPLDRHDLGAVPVAAQPLSRWAALGFATSLARALAPESSTAPSAALFVSSAQVAGDAAGVATRLPGEAREREALARYVRTPPVELSGSRATPDGVLRALASAPVAHFAVHGFDSPAGGFLQLAGDDGRLAARDLATVRLPRSRVVLAACDAAGPAANGLPWAFARAGALAVVAAQERADDAAAAAWAQRFYAALAQGNGFARANREALLAVPEARFIVTK